MASTKRTVISRPVARSERLLVETVGDETVIYDQDTNLAHALKPLAAAVFAYADGTNTAAEIADLASYRLDQQITEAEVNDAVAQLDSLSLLDAPEFDSDGSGISRRTALKVFAATGAGAAALVTTATASASTVNQAGLGWYACPKINGSITYGTQTWPQPGASPDGSGYSWQAEVSGSNEGEEPFNSLGSPVYYNEPCVYTDTDCAVGSGVCVTPGTAATSATCTIPTGTCSYRSGSSTKTATLTALDCYTEHPGTSSHITTWTEGTGKTVEDTTAGNCSAWDVTTADKSSGGYMTMSGTNVTHSGSGSGETYTFTPPSSAYNAGTAATLTGYKAQSSQGSCSSSNWVRNGVVGGWECVPCDGTRSGNNYSCCSVVCTPTTTNPNSAVPLTSPGEKWDTAADGGFSDKNGNHYKGYEVPEWATSGYNGKYCTGLHS